MLGEKAQAIVLERERGDTLVAIAERHGVSHQRVSAIVRDATALVTRVELDLMVDRKTGAPYELWIPYSAHYTVSLAFFDWLLGRLRDRGLEVAVSTRPASNGLALLIEDVTDYSKGTER